MAKKSSGRLHIAPLHKYTLEAITDPAELARIDEDRKRQGKGALVYGLSTDLEAEDKCRVIIRIAGDLDPEQQLTVLQELAAQLPPDAHRQLAKQLGKRDGKL